MHIVPANTLSRLIIDTDKDWNAKDIGNVGQMAASLINTPMASESTLIVAASDSINKEHANLVCDGTDDQVEINSAIENCPSGGKVVLTEGQFAISSRINGKSNVDICGCGHNTILYEIQNVNLDAVIYYGDASKFTISNLKIDSDSQNVDIKLNGIKIENCLEFTIHNVYIANIGKDAPETADNSNQGIFVIDSSHGNISDCKVYVPDAHYGIAARCCNFISITGCTVISAEHHGIAIRGEWGAWDTATRSNNCAITGCTVEHVSDGNCIWLSACTSSSATGNTVYVPAGANNGIGVKEVKAVSVTGNTVRGEVPCNNSMGINVAYSAHNSFAITVSGNSIWGCKNGIITSEAGVNIVGNSCYNQEDAGINITNNECLVNSNNIFDSGDNGINARGDWGQYDGNNIRRAAAFGIDEEGEGDQNRFSDTYCGSCTSGAINITGANSLENNTHNQTY